MGKSCISFSSTLDGWTTADVEYKWKQPDPVQFAKNLFLPGGFELTRWVIKSNKQSPEVKFRLAFFYFCGQIWQTFFGTYELRSS